MRENPVFPSDFADYLTAHDWVQREDIGTASVVFFKKNMRLVIKGDAMDLFMENPFRADGKPIFELIHAFTGWTALSFFTFQLLMHTLGVVTLQRFLANVKKEVTGDGSPAAELLTHFTLIEQRKTSEAY
jgi:hypothetical protein